jgi:hypothetical protein
MFFTRKSKLSTGRMIIGLGALLAGMGRLVGGRAGDSITGFGLASMVLGALNLLRPRLRGR